MSKKGKRTKAAAPIVVQRDYRNLNVLELLAKYGDQPEREEPAQVLRQTMLKVSGYVVQPYWRRKRDSKR
jgi:hypothetical protein